MLYTTKMRVLMISSGLDKKFGGPPEAVTGAACGLSNLGIDVTVAVFGQTQKSWNESHFPKYLESNSVRTVLFPAKSTSRYGGKIRFNEIRILWNEIKSADFVTLHQVYNYQNVIATFMIRIFRRKFAVMPHGTMTSYQSSKHLVRKFLMKPIFMGGIVSKADRIFVATQIERDEIPHKWKHKTSIVGLGFSAPQRKVMGTRLNNDHFTFIFVGRLAQKKRIDITLQALKLASDISGKTIKLIICGTGDNRIVDLISEYAKSNGKFQIEYKGWVGGEMKELELNRADCFILTSEDENFAIAVAEGLSFGLPCLISSKVALSELINKHEAGIVFDELNTELIANEAIRMMDSNLTLLSENALIASKELSWDIVSKIWLQEINQVVS
jgi:glycosyltransferase involved in cell wall biosynthesis